MHFVNIITHLLVYIGVSFKTIVLKLLRDLVDIIHYATCEGQIQVMIEKDKNYLCHIGLFSMSNSIATLGNDLD